MSEQKKRRRGMSLDQALSFACDSECQGRCQECPQDVIEAALNTGGWQPIATAPKDRIQLHEQRAVGGWKHKGYGWIWGPLDYHPDKHHKDGGYFLANGGEPTHWTTLPAPPLEGGSEKK